MTGVRVESVARSLGVDLVDAVATVVVQAWDRNGPYTNVDGARAVGSERVELVVRGDVVTRNGVPVTLLEFPPSSGAFAYRWDVSWRSGTQRIPAFYTEMPASGVFDLGELQRIDPDTLAPTDENVAAWVAAIGTVETLAAEAAESARVAVEAVDTPGRVGPSAYQVAVDAGFVGSEAEWVASLRGQDGADGAPGDPGPAPTTQDYQAALTPLLGVAGGVGTLTGAGKQPESQVPDRLATASLTRAFVSVRTSDGQNLPPGTVVLITIDKTLAQVTASPVADIADITFQTGG